MISRSLIVVVAVIGRQIMFIAMNRFRVKKGSEEAFEKVWLTRETYLDRVPGFVEFHLLKGPQAEDHTLYASHTIWQSKSAFEAWTRSDEFRAAHARDRQRVDRSALSRASEIRGLRSAPDGGPQDLGCLTVGGPLVAQCRSLKANPWVMLTP